MYCGTAFHRLSAEAARNADSTSRGHLNTPAEVRWDGCCGTVLPRSSEVPYIAGQYFAGKSEAGMQYLTLFCRPSEAVHTAGQYLEGQLKRCVLPDIIQCISPECCTLYHIARGHGPRNVHIRFMHDYFSQTALCVRTLDAATNHCGK